MNNNRLSLSDLLLDRAELRYTNPVFWIEQLAACFEWDSPANWTASQLRLTRFVMRLQQQRIALPRAAVETFIYRGFLCEDHTVYDVEPTARVVGLLADTKDDVGFVVPLDASVSAAWEVASLPFDESRLQDLVSRLITSLGVCAVESLPERLAFRVDTAFRSNERIAGLSMDVAGLLALVDAADGCKSPLLQCACAVVMAERGTDKLCHVGQIETKLSAFRREFTRGSLLVRSSDCPSAGSFDSAFDVVWTVNSFRELGDRLHQSDLLGGFLKAVSLDRHQFEVASERLRVMVEHEHRYVEALYLAERLTRCCKSSQLPSPSLVKLRELHEDLLRHTGQYERALAMSGQSKEYLQSIGEASSHEVHCNADVNYAAGLFDPHRFEEMRDVLTPWVGQIDKDPMYFDARTRVKVFNTLARALVVLGCPGWEQLFQRSHELQVRIAPADCPRTRNYLIHGLLRSHRAFEARAEINNGSEADLNDKMSGWMRLFLRAELERQSGSVWDDNELEQRLDSSNLPGHPIGFYFQATARQAGRTPHDAADRFRRARDFFRKGLPDGDTENVLQFLATCMELAEAAWVGSTGQWSDSINALDRFVRRDASSGFRAYYDSELDRLRHQLQSKESADLFLSRVPFF